MRPVLDTPLISFVNEAKSTARALAWFEASLRESSRQMRNLEAAFAPEIRLMEAFRQIRKAVPTIPRAVATPQMQPDREREPAAPIAPVADSHVAPAAPVPSGKQNRGNRSVRPGTMAAALALGFYISNHSYNSKLTASALAQFAANFAALEGLKGADLLDPRGSTMLTMAEVFLNAWKATSKVAAQNQKVAAH
jgi:hypothetical protein